MPNYQNTIIYKLINYDCPEHVYVGSTTNWVKRKQYHKNSAINSICNHKKYVIIRETGGWENWNMIKICDFPCNNKREAEKEEDKYMLELKANMNSRRSYRTNKEWCEDNKDKIKEDKKQYYEDNKDKILETNKKYRDNNKDKILEKKKEKMTCECGSCFRKHAKARHEKTKKHQDYLKSITQ